MCVQETTKANPEREDNAPPPPPRQVHGEVDHSEYILPCLLCYIHGVTSLPTHEAEGGFCFTCRLLAVSLYPELSSKSSKNLLNNGEIPIGQSPWCSGSATNVHRLFLVSLTSYQQKHPSKSTHNDNQTDRKHYQSHDLLGGGNNDPVGTYHACRTWIMTHNRPVVMLVCWL